MIAAINNGFRPTPCLVHESPNLVAIAIVNCAVTIAIAVNSIAVRDVDGVVITSGYRVDNEGKPGGGGLMFIAATNYEEALKIVQQDPLVANDCVDWELNGWIGQVGELQLR